MPRQHETLSPRILEDSRAETAAANSSNVTRRNLIGKPTTSLPPLAVPQRLSSVDTIATMAAAAGRSTGNSLLRVSQACETLKDGFNSGKAAAIRSCLVSRTHAVAVSERSTEHDDTAGRGPSDALLPVRTVYFTSRATFPSFP